MTFVYPMYPVDTVFFGGSCREGVEDIERVDEEEAYGHTVQVCTLKVVWEKPQTAVMVSDMLGDV